MRLPVKTAQAQFPGFGLRLQKNEPKHTLRILPSERDPFCFFENGDVRAGKC